MATSACVRLLCVGAFATTVLGSSLSADHQWSNYHWARTTSEFTLTVVNSLTSDWDGYAAASVSDWSESAVLDLLQDPNGSLSDRDRRRCSGPAGQVRICNMTFGFNGWLGVAGISVDTDGHIFTGYVKVNDTYFDTAFYNDPVWRQSVVCQELGHVIGLDHPDEDFDNDPLFTCMDYQDPPHPVPNDHDFEELEAIYAHRDSFDSYVTDDGAGGGGGGGGTCNAPPGKGCNKAGVPHGERPGEWGISLGRRGAKERFLRIDPDGTRHITFVVWARGR
jgi:hypothetical protein